jgi:ATP-binding cassette subfamily B protein
MSLIAFVFKISQKFFVRQQNELGKINGQVEEIFSNQTIINVNNAYKKEEVVFNDTNSKLQKSSTMSQALSGMMIPLMAFAYYIGYLGVIILACLLRVANVPGFIGGDVVAMIASFMMFVQLFQSPISQIGQGVNGMQSAIAATERVLFFLNRDEMENEENKLTIDNKKIKGNVCFKNVKFSYVKGKEIIHDFSCNVKAGQKIAIVGPTGAGKTTLVNLLMRFYDIDSGTITIDELDTSKIKREEIRKCFSMVLQDT